MTDSKRNPTDPVQSAIMLAARRIAEFLVMITISIVVFQRGPFWQWPWFFRLVTSFVVAAAFFLVYAGVLSHRRSKSGANRDATGQEHLAFRTFRVPENFGMRTIVLAMLAFAVLTAMLRSLQVPPIESLVVITIVSLVSAMQIFMNRVPRMASSIMGAGFGILLGTLYCLGTIRLPAFVLEFDYYFPPSLDSNMAFSLIAGCVLGILAGYAVGALVAGVFLFTEVVGQWWNAERLRESAS